VGDTNLNLHAFQTLFPGLREGKFRLKAWNASPLPLWLRTAADIYKLDLGPLSGCPEIFLIQPKEDLAFDQLLNVYKQVSARTGPHTLLVADTLNPKHRPLLVKFQVPFVYRDESIFAPSLALMFNRLRPYELPERMEGRELKTELRPFSLKLASAYLTRQLPREFTLRLLHQRLVKAGASLSLAKLSSVVTELVQNGFVDAVGAGPTKSFRFGEPKKVWDALCSARLSPFMRVVHDHYLPPGKKDYVAAGETALAGYSELAEPSVRTIATQPAILRQMKSKGVPFGDFGGLGVYIEVWKQDPRLFSMAGKLNPIELYISMREHADERVQSALETMLSKYGLIPKGG